MRNKSAESLPTNPSSQGWTPNMFKMAITHPMFDSDYSLLALIEEVIKQANETYESQYNELKRYRDINSMTLVNSKGDINTLITNAITTKKSSDLAKQVFYSKTDKKFYVVVGSSVNEIYFNLSKNTTIDNTKIETYLNQLSGLLDWKTNHTDSSGDLKSKFDENGDEIDTTYYKLANANITFELKEDGVEVSINNGETKLSSKTLPVYTKSQVNAIETGIRNDIKSVVEANYNQTNQDVITKLNVLTEKEKVNENNIESLWTGSNIQVVPDKTEKTLEDGTKVYNPIQLPTLAQSISPTQKKYAIVNSLVGYCDKDDTLVNSVEVSGGTTKSINKCLGVATRINQYLFTIACYLKPNTEYTLKLANRLSNGAQITLATNTLDETYKIVSSYNFYNEKTFTTNNTIVEGTLYYLGIRGTFTEESDLENVMLVEGSTAPTTFVPYHSDLKSVSLSSVQVGGENLIGSSSTYQAYNGQTIKFNLYDSTTITEGYALNSDGTISDQPSYAQFFVSDYIQVKPSTTYTRKGGNGSNTICYYNKDKSFLQTQYNGENLTFTTPSGAHLMRINDGIAYKETLAILEGSSSTYGKKCDLHSSDKLFISLENGNVVVKKLKKYAKHTITSIVDSQWEVSQVYFKYKGITDAKTNALIYTNDSNIQRAGGYGTIMCDFIDNRMWIRNDSLFDDDFNGAFKTYIASHQLELVYELATPTLETIATIPCTCNFEKISNVVLGNVNEQFVSASAEKKMGVVKVDYAKGVECYGGYNEGSTKQVQVGIPTTSIKLVSFSGNTYVEGVEQNLFFKYGNDYYINNIGNNLLQVNGNSMLVNGDEILYNSGNKVIKPTDIITFAKPIKFTYLGCVAYNLDFVDSVLEDKVVSTNANASTIVSKLVSLGYPSDILAYNEVDLESKKVKIKWNRVDLGSLTWEYKNLSGNYTNPNYFNTTLSDAKNVAPTTKFNANCSLYKISVADANTFLNGNMNISLYQNGLSITNSNFNDATTFKSSLQGQYLYYELATPIEVDISDIVTDDDILLEVVDGGTIEVVSDGVDYKAKASVSYLTNTRKQVYTSGGGSNE